MLLTLFIVAQLAFDVVLLLLLAVRFLRPRPPVPPPPPPEWYQHFLRHTHDLLVATEPVLRALEARRFEPGRRAPEPAVEPGPADPRDRRREALALLRAGLAADEVAHRTGLPPGELRLMRAIVVAEAPSALAGRA
jgi:hypothetical protein